MGDGNFSFSLAFYRKRLRDLPAVKDRIVATSLESLERVLLRPRAGENLKQLKDYGVTILHRVDATKLESCEGIMDQHYDVIIFNFPHTGGKGKIQSNRILLRDFFISSSQVLSECGEVRVTLCRGQGGTPADSAISNIQRKYEDTWKVVEMASEGGLVLNHVEPFVQGEYPDYIPTGYRGHTDKGFHLEGALVHTFTFPSLTRPALYPPTYLHDISFWADVEFKSELFESLAREMAQDYVMDVKCIDMYRPALEPERVGWCYRLVYSSHWDALSRSRAAELQSLIRRAVEDKLNVKLR